jgi:hypothetical protein
MHRRWQEYALSIVAQGSPPARETGTDVFDALFDPWQLVCMVLVIAVVVVAGRWYGVDPGERAVDGSARDATADPERA